MGGKSKDQKRIEELEAENARLRAELELAEIFAGVFDESAFAGMRKIREQMRRILQEREDARRELRTLRHEIHEPLISPHALTAERILGAEFDEATGRFRKPPVGVAITFHLAPDKCETFFLRAFYLTNDLKIISAAVTRAILELGVVPNPKHMVERLPASLKFLEQHTPKLVRLFAECIVAKAVDYETYLQKRLEWWKWVNNLILAGEANDGTHLTPKARQTKFYDYVSAVIESSEREIDSYAGDSIMKLPVLPPQTLE